MDICNNCFHSPFFPRYYDYWAVIHSNHKLYSLSLQKPIVCLKSPSPQKPRLCTKIIANRIFYASQDNLMHKLGLTAFLAPADYRKCLEKTLPR